jgi:hypothetical protein
MVPDWIDRRFEELKKLAEERFGPLSEAENKILRAAIAGNYAWCGPSHMDNDPLNDPTSKNEWDKERKIRAEVLRWLCLDKAAEIYVDFQGIWIHGAKISSHLNLNYSSVRFPLGFRCCRFSGEVRLISARLPSLVLSGSTVPGLAADGAEFQNSVFLDCGFSATGAVGLVGVQIDGMLVCDGGTFRDLAQANVSSSGTALSAGSIVVKGNVHLRFGFAAEGQVDLQGAQIGGDLDCEDGTFKNLPQKDLTNSGLALCAQRATVKGDVRLSNGFVAEGQINLQGIQIDGAFDCEGGTFKNSRQKGLDESGTALLAGRASIKRSVRLRYGFSAEGEVNLLGAQIGGNLDCGGGTFKNLPQEDIEESGTALMAEGTSVAGDVFLSDGFVAAGEVSLLGAQVGGDLECSGATFHLVLLERATVKQILFWSNIKSPGQAELALDNTSVASLVDDQESWPSAGKLSLDGFTYGRIAGGPNDSKSRLDWVGRQKSFSAQPYRHLAKILRDEGDDEGARTVIYEMEKRKHQDSKRGWFPRFWNPIFRWTIGYGVYPRRAIWGLVLLVALGWGFYRCGYFSGAMTPTNQETYNELHNKKRLLPHYPHFYALIYSAENSFPLVNLGQRETWTPDSNQQGFASFLRVFRWIQILLGWALATFFVAGVTGIARKE